MYNDAAQDPGQRIIRCPGLLRCHSFVRCKAVENCNKHDANSSMDSTINSWQHKVVDGRAQSWPTSIAIHQKLNQNNSFGIWFLLSRTDLWLARWTLERLAFRQVDIGVDGLAINNCSPPRIPNDCIWMSWLWLDYGYHWDVRPLDGWHLCHRRAKWIELLR